MSTIRNVLTAATTQLTTHLSEAALESEILLAHALEKPRTWLYTWPEHELTSTQISRFNTFVARRLRGEPSAYITGEREFWSLSLEVTPDTLIPRPETELLVELALEHIPMDQVFNIADLGTGSGAIALALATERPRSTVFAVDFSVSALAVAKRNRARHSLDNMVIYQGDWLAPLAEHTFQVIVSNPPYIRENDPHLTTGELPFEPRCALVAVNNGLDDIRKIVTDSRARFTTNGWLLIEHGCDQAMDVTRLFEEHGYHNVTAHRDLSGQPRVISGQYNPNSK